jgi:two-component system NtrC family response regulator/two-component system response regulator AtoC
MRAVRILLVDDEAEIVRLLTRRLSRLGYDVTGAGDGTQALALLQQAPFDVAILDFMMPGMNGLELADQCRSRFPGVRILMLTGSPIVAEIESARYPCLRKPLENLRELELAVEQLLAERGSGPGGGGD